MSVTSALMHLVDRRQQQRRQVTWPALWKAGEGSYYRGFVRDASGGGIFLEAGSQHKLAPGARVELAFITGSDGQAEAAKRFGTVRWAGLHRPSGRDGVGVQFDAQDVSFTRSLDEAAPSARFHHLFARLARACVRHPYLWLVLVGLAATTAIGALPSAPPRAPIAATVPVLIKPTAAPVDKAAAIARLIEDGHRQLNDRRLKKALTFYEQARAMGPEEPRVYRSLGVAYTMLGQTAHAVSAYKTYVALDPLSSDAPALRAMIAQYEAGKGSL